MSTFPLVNITLDGTASHSEYEQAEALFNAVAPEVYRFAELDSSYAPQISISDDVEDWNTAALAIRIKKVYHNTLAGRATNNPEEYQVENTALGAINAAANELVSSLNYRNNGQHTEAEIDLAAFNQGIEDAQEILKNSPDQL
jgi:hypothetical protein